MNWYKKANNKIDWDTARNKLISDLGREPTPGEVSEKMLQDAFSLDYEKKEQPLKLKTLV